MEPVPGARRGAIRSVSHLAEKKPSFHDIARMAGVGVGTVSRVLNDHPSVAQATPARVERVMAELEYRPTFAARRIRSGRSQLFGFATDPVLTTALGAGPHQGRSGAGARAAAC